jgi:hypothetical protein
VIVFHIVTGVRIGSRGGMQAYRSGAITSTNYKPNYNMLTLPRSLIRSIANDQAGPKHLEQRGGETLGEDVGVL